MKFKVGDKVKHKEYGFGKIVYIDEEEKVMPYAVQFKIFNENLHDLGELGAISVKSGHGWWSEECDLELYTQQPHNLIPQIAKMLGVEIGEEFKVNCKENDLYKFTESCLYKKKSEGYWSEEWYMLGKLLNGFHEIQKLPQKPKLTEAERVILENLPKEYTHIKRSKYDLNIYYDDDTGREFGYLNMFKHLFQFIKLEDKEPYKIQELLEEYEKGKSNE